MPEGEPSEPNSVEAVIHYVDPSGPIGGIDDVERERSTFRLVPHVMPIRDARPLRERLALETNGFVWLRHPTSVADFTDERAVEQVYLPEAAAIVRRLMQADHVLVFGHVRRDGSLNTSPHRPVFNAHIDYDEPTVRAIARRLLGAEEYERRASQRIVLSNVWRPLAPVERNPLALCDASSVRREDLVFGPIVGKSASGLSNASGWNLAYSPRHRWHYLSRMQPDEVLVFKLCDTDEERVQWTAHTSFEDPASAAEAPQRRSIEVRTLAFI
ncbi:MAG TPA: CmcJ/NvfI family oxidoreductase [Steroidobacteraceae bacterium]|nr:CmcJ/NvfI family oxidoreductase [Steroidobacteraceae bacterium]